MDRDQTMAETGRAFAPSATEIAGNQWLPDAEIAVYAEEYERTAFQGGLNWYRASLEPHLVADLTLFSGKTIGVPSMFISGQSDWGTYQMPGALDIMRERAFTHMTGVRLVARRRALGAAGAARVRRRTPAGTACHRQSVVGGLVEDDYKADDLAVTHAEVVRQNKIVGQIGPVERTVVGSAHDGIVVMTATLANLDPH